MQANFSFTQSDLIETPQESPNTPREFSGAENDTIGLKSASFTWDDDNVGSSPGRAFKLAIEGELLFRRGKINLITGQSGSGKTSMLMALLGEMYYHPLSSQSFVKLPRLGGVAYQAQESWILSETIRVRSNITQQYRFD